MGVCVSGFVRGFVSVCMRVPVCLLARVCVSVRTCMCAGSLVKSVRLYVYAFMCIRGVCAHVRMFPCIHSFFCV